MILSDVLWEATDAVSADPLPSLAQYGVLGIIVILLVLYARASIKRENDRADKAEQQVIDLNQFIRQELLPKQVEATVMYKQVTDALEQAIQMLTEMKYRDGYQAEPPRSRRAE